MFCYDRGRIPHEVTLDEFLGAGKPDPSICVQHDGYVTVSEREVRPDTVRDLNGASQFDLEELEGYAVAALRNGRDAVLLHETGDGEWELVGQYVGSSLNLLPGHRGKGLSRFLILAAAELRDGVPCPHGSYTPEGYAAHRAAHRLAVRWALEGEMPVPDAVLADYPGLAPPPSGRRP